MLRRILLATIMLGVSSIAVVASTVVPVSAYAPTSEFTFNNPYGSSTEQYAITDQMNQGLQNAPAGSTVRIAMFSNDTKSYTDAVIDAYNRGVHVQVVTSGHSTSSDYWKRFAETLGTDKTQKSFATACDGGCFTSRNSSYQHAKFLVFSQTGTAKQVVMVASANPTLSQAERGFNNMYTMIGNTSMYTAFAKYFDSMAASSSDNKVEDGYKVHSSGDLSAIFLPSVKSRSHPYKLILDKVSCKAKGDYGRDNKTIVRVGMSQWNEANSGLAKTLVALAKKGCVVEVIISGHGVSAATQRELLKGVGVRNYQLYNASRDVNGDRKIDYYIHDKAISVNGGFGSSQTFSTWVGSMNLTTSGFKSNNEVILKIQGKSAWQKYTDHFQEVKKNSVPMTSVFSIKPDDEQRVAARQSTDIETLNPDFE